MAVDIGAEVATVTAFGDDNEPTDHDLYGNAHRGSDDGVDYPQSLPVLSAPPFYLPNLIAAIVVGIVVGSVGTWASASTVGVNLSAGGPDIEPWGLITLILGGASAVASSFN